jgi:hypothetical protein
MSNVDVEDNIVSAEEIKGIAQQMFDNGYMPLPLLAGSNRPYINDWQNLCAARDFDALWGCVKDVNIGIYCGGSVCILDFDAHGPAPNGITAYDLMTANHPNIFAGCIIAKSASGGRHVYFRGMPGRKTYMLVAGVKNEVLRGNCQAACPPSVRPSGNYTYVTESTPVNTSTYELPMIPQPVFDYIKAYQESLWRPAYEPKKTYSKDELGAADIDVVVEYYRNKDWGTGSRHDDARKMVRCLLACGVSEARVEEDAKDYIRGKGRELTDDSEVRRMIEWAKDMPLEPCIPWNAVIDARAERAIKRILGGKQ